MSSEVSQTSTKTPVTGSTLQYVNGVQCIVWDFVGSTSIDKKHKRQLKDKMGAMNKNVPMLDTKSAGLRKEYNDVIVYCEDVVAWESAIREYYINNKQVTTKITGGHQVIISDVDDSQIFVTVNFYNKTNKIMVQPGERKEDYLLEWIKAVPTLLRTINKSSSSESSVETQTALCNQEPVTSTSLHSTSVAVSPANNGLESASQGETMIVSATQKEHGNEMLCFIQNRLNILPLDDITKICADFYSADEISNGKALVFSLCLAGSTNQRHIKRRGTNKGRDDVFDMCKLLLSLESEHTPRFLARDLGNLPPFSADDIGLGKVLKQVEEVKKAVMILTQSHSSLADFVGKKYKQMFGG